MTEEQQALLEMTRDIIVAMLQASKGDPLPSNEARRDRVTQNIHAVYRALETAPKQAKPTQDNA